MKTRQFSLIILVVLVAAAFSVGSVAGAETTTTDFSGPVKGAIFTTTETGDVVNENTHYAEKADVYLDGGPGPNAPATAAALLPGDYYFQVTDPSGKDLLSTEHISCRQFHVNDEGVIDKVYQGHNYVREKGDWVQVPCEPETGVDSDHSELGALTVQLAPFDDTPNPGGVYKVWVTPTAAYAGDADYTPESPKDQVNGENYEPANYHGFLPRYSKTDNFKIAQKKPFITPMMDVQKFHDANLNAHFDEGEELVTGWKVDVTDPLAVTNTFYTSASFDTSTPGIYTAVEETPERTLQTSSFRDGERVSAYPQANPAVDVNVAGESEEHHSVLFGNIGLGQVTACKVYDANANGMYDEGETTVEGWKMQLTGTAVNGEEVPVMTQFTGADGCTTFTDLLPGDYTVEEVMPEDDRWVSSGPMSTDVSIESTLDGNIISGTSHVVTFTNYYASEKIANFDTKGYWHNKNGLTELSQEDIDYVNSLAPYSQASTYFGDGDEPFDGYFDDGTEVKAAFNDADGTLIWSAGTYQAEISHFLVDRNANGMQSDPREQLAQQLLAFIFNLQHRTEDGVETKIWFGNSWVSGEEIIQDAIDAWQSDNHDLQVAFSSILDDYNNNDTVAYLSFTTASVSYPTVEY